MMRRRLARRLGAPLRYLSPTHRRWRRLLDSLTVVPSQLPRPVAAPSDRDFVICGCPRSGTTLMAAALHQPPHVVTVSEPWDGLRLPPRELFADLRGEIAATGRLARGRLDADGLRATGVVRWTREGEGSYAVDAPDDHLLGVKWPTFWQYLDLLPNTRFVVCVRHPAEVVDSARRHGGRLVMGLDYDAPFNADLNAELEAATADWRLRRVLLYEHIHRRILPHLGRENVFVARYERWFDDRDGLLDEVGSFLGVDVGDTWVAVADQPSTPELSPHEWGLIVQCCPSARRLGYDLDRTGTTA